MTAPTNPGIRRQKTLANTEPSTHDPLRTSQSSSVEVSTQPFSDMCAKHSIACTLQGYLMVDPCCLLISFIVNVGLNLFFGCCDSRFLTNNDPAAQAAGSLFVQVQNRMII